MGTIIRFEGVSKGYKDKKVLDNIDLEIEEGEFLSIIGTSGCGKTTLIKVINGLITPEEGKIFIDNKDLKVLDIIKLRRKIGYVVQGIGLFPHMTIRENISYVLKLEKKRNQKEINEKVNELLEMVALDKEVLNRYPGELSGGQCQRVGIARALVNNPKILLMDEPFSAVDEINRQLLQEQLIKIYRKLKITILFITHDIREAFKLSTRIIIMENVKIAQNGTPKEILENPKTEFIKRIIQSIEK